MAETFKAYNEIQDLCLFDDRIQTIVIEGEAVLGVGFQRSEEVGNENDMTPKEALTVGGIIKEVKEEKVLTNCLAVKEKVI